MSIQPIATALSASIRLFLKHNPRITGESFISTFITVQGGRFKPALIADWENPGTTISGAICEMIEPVGDVMLITPRGIFQNSSVGLPTSPTTSWKETTAEADSLTLFLNYFNGNRSFDKIHLATNGSLSAPMIIRCGHEITRHSVQNLKHASLTDSIPAFSTQAECFEWLDRVTLISGEVDADDFFHILSASANIRCWLSSEEDWVNLTKAVSNLSLTNIDTAHALPCKSNTFAKWLIGVAAPVESNYLTALTAYASNQDQCAASTRLGQNVTKLVAAWSGHGFASYTRNLNDWTNIAKALIALQDPSKETIEVLWRAVPTTQRSGPSFTALAHVLSALGEPSQQETLAWLSTAESMLDQKFLAYNLLPEQLASALLQYIQRPEAHCTLRNIFSFVEQHVQEMPESLGYKLVGALIENYTSRNNSNNGIASYDIFNFCNKVFKSASQQWATLQALDVESDYWVATLLALNNGSTSSSVLPGDLLQDCQQASV